MSSFFWNSDPIPAPPPVAPGGGGTGGWGGQTPPHWLGGPPNRIGGQYGVPPQYAAAQALLTSHLVPNPGAANAPGAPGPGTGNYVQAPPFLDRSGEYVPVGGAAAGAGAGWTAQGTHAPPWQPGTGGPTSTGTGQPPTGIFHPIGWPGDPRSGGGGGTPPPWWAAFQQYIGNRFPHARNWFGPPGGGNPPYGPPGGPAWRPPGWVPPIGG